MTEKKQLILRISPTLWEELNKMAADDFRSLNSEIEYILTTAVRNKNTKAKVLAEELVGVLSFCGEAKKVKENN
ncbi:putative uncharacterized protein [Acidaminococcus sp. CAG:917]|nr:putative uncharacterized protein [Acidaminococcus sp. CAG:917]